jgi:hypothetical protein
MTAASIEVACLINSAINELPLRNCGWDDVLNVIDNYPMFTPLSAIAPPQAKSAQRTRTFLLGSAAAAIFVPLLLMLAEGPSNMLAYDC